ncbi:MBL fold metallo-hydrolase [Lacrimispora aerotolerans]|jgi:phosphoribosyl 1,2-cyclic phosphate phosphodiesterase|uniref:MBL fold metallo-hydrolase n=1 Tax=Lacrimispora aerotolerans TaxID=36832 RepID=UPI00047E843B|nr:MBL fold metallo-hydrolase [Lacrimispora aerotolerans]
MKFNIIGSGGCVSIPRPLCKCRVCREARVKGVPYARCGCSLYAEDIHVLVDTPEDIVQALNRGNVESIDYILYSHIDPDHTMGMRVMEQLRLDWLAASMGEGCKNPIVVGALPKVLKDLESQRTAYGSMLSYYKSLNLITEQPLHELNINGIHVDLVPVDDKGDVTVFVFTEGDKKLIYAPCDVKPFPESESFYEADCLIIGNTIIGDVLKDGFVLEESNSLRTELFVMEEIIAIQEKYKIKRVIITHLEEDWGKSYDDYKCLEKKYEAIEFAYDGMKIEI